MAYTRTDYVCLAQRFCCALLCGNGVAVIKAEAGFSKNTPTFLLSSLAMSFFWIFKENIMHDKFRRYGWMIAFGFLVTFISGYGIAAELKAATQNSDSTKLELHVSPDGHSLVDQSGKEVGHFNDDIKMSPAKSGDIKMKGCMRCVPDCAVYDGERCVKQIRSCTWDFDC